MHYSDLYHMRGLRFKRAILVSLSQKSVEETLKLFMDASDFDKLCLGLVNVLCPMSKSPSRKRECLQDKATRKKGSLLLTRVRAPATSNAVMWGQRALSPSCYTNL